MKVVALVSGGKDSTYNMLHCVLQGHDIVAMANLHPPASAESDEMDSFMYQTVGSNALEMYSECMGGVPMYRQAIMGTSAIQTLEYKPVAAQNDETEDLYQLLQTVVQNHPEVKGVSVGAILSTYQRTRVENVCQRLGLTSLAYLWERSQSELLDEIIEGGVDARIIKTAAYGLGKRHLGQSLGDIRSELIKMNSMFGLHLCGEGGEYETLVFDSPLFVKRLVANTRDIVGSAQDEVYHLSLRDFSTVQKDEETDEPFGLENIQDWKHKIALPPLLEDNYQEILDQITTEELIDETPEVVLTSVYYEVAPSNTSASIYNLTAPLEAKHGSIEEEARQLFLKVSEVAKTLDISSSAQFTFSSLILSSMSDFQTVNSIYSTQFLEPLPPARACIESRNIINGMRIQLSLNYVPSFIQKSGLHIQGRSYWAPANIGPYSQATKSQGVIFLAGQIPLIPASMELVDSSTKDALAVQAVLGLQHLNRVRIALRGTETFAYIVAIVSSAAAGKCARDVWHLFSDDVLHGLKPPMFVVQVSGLPRGAWVEWAGLGIDQVDLDAFDSGDDDDSDDNNNTENVNNLASKYRKKAPLYSTNNTLPPLPEVQCCYFGTQIVAAYSLPLGAAAAAATTTNSRPTLKSRQDFERLLTNGEGASSKNNKVPEFKHLTGTLYVTPTGVPIAKEWASAYGGEVEQILVDSVTSFSGEALSVALITRGQWVV